MTGSQSSTVIGVFKGMGDLLCAAPVIQAELERKRTVHVLLFPGSALAEFGTLIDFSPHQNDLRIHAMPTSLSMRRWRRFLGEMRNIQPELVWISPCAPAADSSWKIPLMLRMIQVLFWKCARLVGAESERLSWLFHQRLPVDRFLPLQMREWSAYRLLRGHDLPERPKKPRFLPEITAIRRAQPRFDLVIHPGANAQNRKWPIEKYSPLVSELPADWHIAFLGLPSDLEEVKRTMPPDRPISYVSGTIRDALETLASASLLLVMDSGNMHFAQVLGVPALAVFGYTDPARVIDPSGCVDTIYEQRFPCQPCMRAKCSQPEVYCLTSVEPATIAAKLRTGWEKLQNPGAGQDARLRGLAF